ncbi:MAG: hypothetical protein Q7S56_03120 [Nanoarchaeota archaeon]|nr:hypothetical protein [Nanoarchaeota archaeon]
MTNERPTLITVLCVLGFIWIVLSTIGIFFFQDFLSKLTNVSVWYSLIIELLLLIGLILVWNMKKMGLIFYTAISVIDYIITIYIGQENYTLFGYLFPLITEGIFIGLMFTKFRLMN